MIKVMSKSLHYFICYSFSDTDKLPKLVARTSSKSCASKRSVGDREPLHALDTLKVWNSRWSNKHDLANAIKRVKEKYGDSILSE